MSLPDQSAAERWRQAKEILADLLEVESPARRAELAAERCKGDPLLLQEVKSLMAQTTSVFEKCVDEVATPLRRELPTLDPGRRIGAYGIVREIGRGGMGAVYLAKRADGEFEKQVAIKVLKRGTDTDEVLRRFRAEREILARLEHPNISRLLDAGTTDDGLPYFVMEYVEGNPITSYADEHQLSIVDRLKLFRVVCAAVSYAHQNLIIHRDLKPSNVLVTAKGEVRLLDFGIAKLVEQAGSEALMVTVTVQRVLTPEYASPEQARGESITTVSDVYSLGIFLYELLTGSRPYKLRQGSAEEMTRAICEQEPERPSTAVTRLGERSDRIESVRRQLRGDLDNIVLKALRKEPSRRYASVDQFSDDIRRHLEGLPVLARKDTFSYRAGKFVERHKLAAAAAVLILLTLIAGIVGTESQARRANRRFNQVRKLAHSILFDYQDQIAALPGSTKVRERLVQDALEYLNGLSREAGNDSTLLRELASAYEKVAAVQGGADNSSRGRLISLSNLGDTRGALESLHKAQAIREQVCALEPANREARHELALCYSAVGIQYLSVGPPEKVVESERKAIPILESLSAANPADEDLQYQLWGAYVGMSKALGNPAVPNLGDTSGALQYKSKAQSIAEKLAAAHPENPDYQFQLAYLHNMADLMLSGKGQEKEALNESLQALAIFQALAKANPADTAYQRQVAIGLGNVASEMLTLNNKSGALAKVKEAQTIYEFLMQADPNDASLRGSAALNYRKVAVALGDNGDKAGALNIFNKAEQMFAELVAHDPSNADFRRQWAYTYLAASKFDLQAGDLNNAVKSAAEGIKIEETLVTSSPTNATARNTLALLYTQLGAAEAKLASGPQTSVTGKNASWRAARDAYQKSLALLNEMRLAGMLAPVDTRAVELAKEIALCDQQLR